MMLIKKILLFNLYLEGFFKFGFILSSFKSMSSTILADQPKLEKPDLTKFINEKVKNPFS